MTATGKPGDRTGVYLGEGIRLLVLMVGNTGVSAGAISNTTGIFDVQSGKEYQFKIVSDHRPILIPGSSSFRCIEIRRIEDIWYFKFVAIGLPGEGCGFYLNHGTKPVAIANIR